MKVVVFTTSWPRHERDWVGRFVSDAVAQAGARGVQTDVVSPGVFRHYGLAYGNGVVANARRKPWRAPFMVASMVRTLRRHARSADLVHAHWLLGGAIARLAGAPYVVTLHGSGSAGRFADLELARRSPRLVHWILGRARVVICVSEALADAARSCGATDVRVIPNGVAVARASGSGEPGAGDGDGDGEEQPPFVLFAGRLSPEKGIDDFLAATDGMPRRIAGDGPLRAQVPEALGMLPHDELLELYGRCAVLCQPSRSEGFGVTIVEAMAAGRPIVATRVGGIPDLVVPEQTGVLVESGDVPALRAALERLLADPALRRRMGAAAQARAAARFGWPAVTDALLAAYEDAVRA